MYKTLVNHRINYQPQLVSWTSEPSHTWRDVKGINFSALLFWGRHFTPDWTTPLQGARLPSPQRPAGASVCSSLDVRKVWELVMMGKPMFKYEWIKKRQFIKGWNIFIYISTKLLIRSYYASYHLSYYLSLFFNSFSDVFLEHLPFLNLCKIPNGCKKQTTPQPSIPWMLVPVARKASSWLQELQDLLGNFRGQEYFVRVDQC